MSLADAAAADAYFAKIRDELVASGQSPYMTLPPKPQPRLVRARMAEALLTLFTSRGAVERDALTAYGFDDVEIAEHFRPALRIARLDRMMT